jgi:hypothetical protein
MDDRYRQAGNLNRLGSESRSHKEELRPTVQRDRPVVEHVSNTGDGEAQI